MTSRPRQWFDYCLLCSLLRLARPMPRTLLLALGRGLGSSTWRVFRFRRQVVRENLGHAFADLDARQRDALALAFYRSLGMTLMEFLVFPRLRRRDFLDLVEMEGIRHLHAAAALGKCALIVTGHMRCPRDHYFIPLVIETPLSALPVGPALKSWVCRRGS